MAAKVRAPAVSGNGVPDEPIWRLGVEQYHAMVAPGIVGEDDPVELLEGWLVTKMTKKPSHTLAKGLVRDAIQRCRPAGWFIGREDPLTTGDSEPEPDVAVIRGDPWQRNPRHPGPGDVALVIEVADTTLRRDQTPTRRIFARAGVPAYWIVNLVDGRIEVYTDPSGPAEAPDYARCADYAAADEVPVLLDGHEVGRVVAGDVLP